MKQNRTLALLAAASILAIAACGDDAPDNAETTVQPAAPPTTPPGPHPGTEPTSPPVANTTNDAAEVTVQLRDYAFSGLPASVPAGTKLVVENTSAIELHEIVAFRIQDSEARSASELIALPEAELLAAVGPVPATVLLAAPGEPQIEALGDGTLTDPGRYLLLCGVPTGVDPGEYLAAAAESVGPPNVPGGPPHFAHGMYAELIVE